MLSSCSQNNIVKPEETQIFHLSEILTYKVEGLRHPGKYINSRTGEEQIRDIPDVDLNMPYIDLYGSLPTTKDEGEKQLSFKYVDPTIKPVDEFEGLVDVKVQGQSSSTLPKINYNIKLKDSDGNKQKVLFNHNYGWAKHNKYTLKGNYNDITQARNTVVSKLYGQVVKSNKNIDNLSNLLLGGAQDGFPIVVYLNDEFYGTYNLMTRKDEKLFDMADSTEQKPTMHAILQNKSAMAVYDSSPSNSFKQTISKSDLQNDY